MITEETVEKLLQLYDQRKYTFGPSDEYLEELLEASVFIKRVLGMVISESK